jgi:glutathione S-transferase
MMQLLDSQPSPFCRKVRVLLHETGLISDVEIVPVTNSPLAPDDTNKAQNPLGKIPTLIRADGPAIYDSRVICRFLDAKAGARLYPEHRIWETLTLEATADGILEAAVLMVYEARFREEALRSTAWLDAQWLKIDRALDALEARWMSHLHGKLDMGQIAVACALGYLDFRHGDRDWRGTRPSLAAWYQVFAARPSMEATVPPA